MIYHKLSKLGTTSTVTIKKNSHIGKQNSNIIPKIPTPWCTYLV
jgi:hypothetical protein